jgi:transcriptional regulator of acetoin/glycerol metabolism
LGLHALRRVGVPWDHVPVPLRSGADVTTLLEDLRQKRTIGEREDVEKALRQFGGNVARAAKYLGISRAALYRRLYAYGLAKPAQEAKP